MSGKTAHVIGIAGIGMSAAALLLKEQGWEVTGSDEAFYPPASDVLAAANISIKSPHSSANIPAHVDRFVIGKHAKLTMENPEVAAAFASGKPVLSYPEVLHEILSGRSPCVVAGSYGKSTTSAILAWSLIHGGVDAGFFVGAIPKGMGSAARLGAHPVFVLEGDEYPSSNTDTRSKFLHYRARDVVLTSASHDHVNVFPTQDDYLKPFRALIAQMPDDGLLIGCKDEPHSLGLAREAGRGYISYSLNDPSADYYARDIRFGMTTRFDVVARGQAFGTFTTQMLGAHNVQNLIGAAAFLLERQLLTPAHIASAFAAFEGVKRRMDRVTLTSRVPVYEGFGSSLDKAKSAIEAMKLHFPDRKLAVVFEPHTFSWRSRASSGWYADVFAGCDLVAVLPPPDHGAVTDDQLSQDEIAALIRRIYGSRLAVLTPSLTDWGPTVLLGLDPHWAVLALSSGSLGGGLTAFARALDRKFS